MKSDGKFIKQTGGRKQYGHVVLTLSPQLPVKVLSLKMRRKARIPKEFIRAVEAGAKEAMEAGELAGYPWLT